MFFEQIRTGGCLSYVIGCPDTCAAIIVDPETDQVDRYLALCSEKGLLPKYVADTHTHADHFSGTRELSRRLGVPIVMHRRSVAPFADMRIDDGELVIVGKLRLRVMYTPGHTDDSLCFVLPDRVLTGDTLLIGGTGRTDLPSGDPEALYDSLFGKLLRLPDELLVFPAHDYKGRSSTTLGAERTGNPRLQAGEREAFVALMRGLDLQMPQHLTEALRTNRSGGKSVKQLIAEAARQVPFMSLEDVLERIQAGDGSVVLLDVREERAYRDGHLPGAINVPRGQLELRADRELPDPTVRILTYCEYGKISTLAAATLHTMGYAHVVALDGGYEAWSRAAYPIETAQAT